MKRSVETAAGPGGCPPDHFSPGENADRIDLVEAGYARSVEDHPDGAGCRDAGTIDPQFRSVIGCNIVSAPEFSPLSIGGETFDSHDRPRVETLDDNDRFGFDRLGKVDFDPLPAAIDVGRTPGSGVTPLHESVGRATGRRRRSGYEDDPEATRLLLRQWVKVTAGA